jgi:chromosome segregation ATPase
MLREMTFCLGVFTTLIGASVSQAQRPTVPYPSEDAALKAEQGRLKEQKSQLLASEARASKMLRDLYVEAQNWSRKWEANEAYLKETPLAGNSSGSWQRYKNTRRQLERERERLKNRTESLKKSLGSIGRDLHSVREKLQRNRERQAELSSPQKPSGTYGLTFDDMAPKKGSKR